MNLDNVEEDMGALLKNQMVGYLCTADAKGVPHVTPMFFLYVFDKHELYFVTDRKSKKASNLLEVSNLAFTVDIRDRENPFNNRGVLLRGELLKLTDLSFELAEKSKTALKTFSEKYHGIIAEEPMDEIIRRFHDVLVTAKIHQMTYWKGPFSRVFK
ncbi:MAG: pyridoxamine 5'-phosphate oxidase family protein [Candidatus Hydrothermarchaeota archaeon]|nr:pyridoxamine 5'-phosphate oxidase family protein [Candidatus Hydrothermarchaeota archaeon]